jgi:cytochrome c oxidase subunit 5a
MSASLLRVAVRGSTSTFFRANTVVVRQAPLAARAGVVVPSLLAASNFSTSTRLRSGEHAEETFEEFTAR